MKKKYFALGGLCALAVVGGTLAYFNQTTSVSNPFNTTSFEGTTVEKFNPTDGEDWKPGVEVSKEVYAKNTGDGDVWVRIKLSENWNASNGSRTISSDAEEFFPESAEKSKQKNATDGETIDDGSVVYKNIVNSDKWTKKEDGFYYYNSKLTKDSKTDPLLESVTLCADTDMGLYVSKYYYATTGKAEDEPAFPGADGTWNLYDGDLKKALGDKAKGLDVYTHTLKELDLAHKGYANDNYTLTITTEFVQADKAAADAAGWTFNPAN